MSDYTFDKTEKREEEVNLCVCFANDVMFGIAFKHIYLISS